MFNTINEAIDSAKAAGFIDSAEINEQDYNAYESFILTDNGAIQGLWGVANQNKTHLMQATRMDLPKPKAVSTLMITNYDQDGVLAGEESNNVHVGRGPRSYRTLYLDNLITARSVVKKLKTMDDAEVLEWFDRDHTNASINAWLKGEPERKGLEAELMQLLVQLFDSTGEERAWERCEATAAFLQSEGLASGTNTVATDLQEAWQAFVDAGGGITYREVAKTWCKQLLS